MAAIVIGADLALPRFDVLAQAGRELTLTLTVLDAAGSPVADGAITKARAMIRPEVKSDQVLHVFSTETDPAMIEIDGPDLIITATPTETSLWQANWGSLIAWWDVEITDGAAVPHQISQPGLITLTPEVTR